MKRLFLLLVLILAYLPAPAAGSSYHRHGPARR
jgi:hypothetical protein